MAKKKEVEDLVHDENLNVEAQDIPLAPVAEQEVTIDVLDFNELLELEKTTKQVADQFDKIAGNIKRLEKDLDVYNTHEKNLNGQIEAKRKELIKRYKINEQRQWRIDINSRKVVYQAN